MKKIMFNDMCGLTNAVLQGRKTMTRRLVGKRMTEDDIKAYLKGYTELANKCAQYKVGELVAVAQSYESMANGGYLKRMIEPVNNGVGFDFKPEYCGNGYGNKMFVKAKLMPHRIRITDIKMERLQDISGDDIQKEGIWLDEKIDRFIVGKKGFFLAKEAFAYLIDKTNGIGTWVLNPWVFAYSFDLVK